jgi:hypothetical protein
VTQAVAGAIQALPFENGRYFIAWIQVSPAD